MAVMAFVMPCAVSAMLDRQSDSLYSTVPPYVRFVVSDDSIRMGDEDFLLHSGSVTFPVNRYDIPDDAALLRELKDNVVPMLKTDSVNLMRVWLNGYASPEGSYINNVLLSKRRRQALLDFLNGQLGDSVDSLLDSNKFDDTEGYRTLLLLMRKADDASYDEVARLCESLPEPGNNDQLKKRLMQLHGGRLWQRLKTEYFPQLRTARLVLWLRKSETLPDSMLPPPTTPVFITGSCEEDADSTIGKQDELITCTETVHRREWLSIKTNLLFYGAYIPGGYDRWCPIPNVAVEYYPLHGHFTFGASFDCPWWKDYSRSKFFEVRNYQLDARYYLRSGSIEKNPPGHGAAFRGFYLQGYVHGGLFEIGFNRDKGWKGEGFGAGLGIGYVMPISRKGHWRLEFGLQAGWFTCKYDPFQYENLINPDYHDGLYYYKWTGRSSDFKKRQHRFNWFGPTRIGITLSYDLLYRRQQKRGISLYSTEGRRVGR